LRLEGRQLSDIGCLPDKKSDTRDYLTGTFIGIGMMVSTTFIIKSLTGFRWEFNPAFKPFSLVTLLVATFGSVYAQELAFRGYPFQLLLKKYGVWPAQSIIAVLFGCMHLMERPLVFSEALLLIFTTGIGSLFYGMAYIKTGRLALPVALHLGWNYCQHLLPRHPVQNGPGIWIIDPYSFDQAEFGFLTWTIPYTIIIILFYAAVSFIYGKRKTLTTSAVKARHPSPDNP